jgi:hypothetical protein
MKKMNGDKDVISFKDHSYNIDQVRIFIQCFDKNHSKSLVNKF